MGSLSWECMVAHMLMLLFACTGEPEPKDPIVEPVDTKPVRIEVESTATPEELLGRGWSVTVQEPVWETSRTIQIKEHEGAIWCYVARKTGRNLASFRHGKTTFPTKEDWVDYPDIADELLMPKGALVGASIYGFAWPSECKDEPACKSLAKKRAQAYERWLRGAFHMPMESSIEVRVEIPERDYPHIEILASGSDFTNWEIDGETRDVPGAQLTLRGEKPDISTVALAALEDLASFARAVDRLGNVAKEPTGDNPRTIHANGAEINFVSMDGSGSWEDVYDHIAGACGVED